MVNKWLDLRPCLEVPLHHLPGEVCLFHLCPGDLYWFLPLLPSSYTILGKLFSLAGTCPLTQLINLKATCDHKGFKSSMLINISCYIIHLSPLLYSFTCISGKGPGWRFKWSWWVGLWTHAKICKGTANIIHAFPCLLQGGWPLKIPFNPKHSVILCDSKICPLPTAYNIQRAAPP